MTSEPPPGAPEAISDLPPPPRSPAVPGDADDTRRHHFERLIRSPATLALAGIVVLATFLAGLLGAGVAVGAAAAAAAIGLALVVVFSLANAAAHDDFFRAYAERRGLRRIEGKHDLPPLTPLLQRGDRRYSEQRFDGVLYGGLEGSLCLYTYEDRSSDSDGDQRRSYFRYTIAIVQLPETAPFIRELFCQRRSGFRFLDAAEDAFRTRRRIEHESEEVDRRYEIFAGNDDDPNRVRQVLSPSFLTWLADHSPQQFAFELVAGALVASVKGHRTRAADLDALCAASAAVAKRLRAEATE